MSDPKDGSEDFAALLEEYGAPAGGRKRLQVGEIVSGAIVSIGREAVFVDLGGKAEGMLELEQVSDDEGQLTVAVGDSIEARVVDLGGRNGCVLLRRHSARGAEARSELASSFEHEIPVEGVVSAVNKGGVEVQVAGLRAFCPISQLDLRFVEDAEAFVGQRLSFRITRYEPGRGDNVNLVLSRRVILEEEAAIRGAELRENLRVGSVVEGVVTTLKPFGAFVDLGGLEGLIHVSQMSFQRVQDPADVLSVGQRVQVSVLEIKETGDAKRPERIALSLKALESDPWGEVAQRFPEGATLQGRIVRLQPFGAFVEVAPGIEGLVHISELGAGRRINHPREVVSEGQEVEVKVVAVDPEARRLSLSMRGDEAGEVDADLAREYLAPDPKPGQGLGTFGDLLKGSLAKPPEK